MAIRRKFNWKLVRRELSYSVREICALFHVHPNTVLRWMRSGLRRIDERRPFMIHGSELIRYLKEAQASRRIQCGPSEFFCTTCREPRLPWEGILDVHVRNKKLLTLSGICDACEKPLFRFGAVSKLAEYHKLFQIQNLRGGSLVRPTSTSGNGDLDTKEANEQDQR